MSTSRRRIVLRILDECDGEAPLKKICYAVAAVDEDKKFRLTDNRDYNLIRSSLQKDGLPQLSAEGVIEWDRQEEIVKRGPRFDEYMTRLRRARLVDR